MKRTTPIMSSCHMNNIIASVCAPSQLHCSTLSFNAHDRLKHAYTKLDKLKLRSEACLALLV